MTRSAAAALAGPRPAPLRMRSFAELRARYDSRVLALFHSRALLREVQAQSKMSLESLWSAVASRLRSTDVRDTRSLQPLEIHRCLVSGLPGEALFISSAMAFDSMAEALELFELSAKTARQRIGEHLAPSEGEVALRIGRVLTMAQEVFASPEAARQFLRTPGFALGGAVPRELLKTAEGEQLVLAELQTQAEGGPV